MLNSEYYTGIDTAGVIVTINQDRRAIGVLYLYNQGRLDRCAGPLEGWEHNVAG
jgi:hypothetical protein